MVFAVVGDGWLGSQVSFLVSNLQLFWVWMHPWKGMAGLDLERGLAPSHRLEEVPWAQGCPGWPHPSIQRLLEGR